MSPEKRLLTHRASGHNPWPSRRDRWATPVPWERERPGPWRRRKRREFDRDSLCLVSVSHYFTHWRWIKSWAWGRVAWQQTDRNVHIEPPEMRPFIKGQGYHFNLDIKINFSWVKKTQKMLSCVTTLTGFENEFLWPRSYLFAALWFSSAAARSGRGNLACRHSVNSWPGRPGNEHKRCFMQHLFQLSPHFHGSFEETSCHEKISSSYNSLLFSVKEFPSFILPLISHTVPQNIFVPFLKDRGRQTAWISIYSPFSNPEKGLKLSP